MVRHFVEQPLPTSFMLMSMIGFLISTLVLMPVNMTWGFTFMILFSIWFIASVFNFTHADGEEHLNIHNSKKYVKN